MSTGFATLAAAAGTRAARYRGSRRARRPRGPSPRRRRPPGCRAAGVGHDRHAAAARQRLVRRAASPTSNSSSSVRSRMTPAWRSSASTSDVVGRPARRCAKAGARAGRPEPPAFTRHDRLGAADPPRDLRELARVAEALQVQQDHLGRADPRPSTAAGRCPRRRPCCRPTRTSRRRGRCCRA